MGLIFSEVCVVGVGLIGGSLALALKRAGMADWITGVGRGKKNLEEAMRLKIIDSYTNDPVEACARADLIVLATPVRAVPEIMKTIKDSLSPGTLVTDVSSTKAGLAESVYKLIPENVDFVPGHPVAGTEKSGCTHAQADLFKDHWTILTPDTRTRPDALDKIKKMWIKLGAKVEIMDPVRHDIMLAAISHLPHLVSYALVDTLAEVESREPVLRFSAGGFRDFARIAGSSPEMWRDIFLENKGPLSDMINLYRDRLDDLADMIEREDADGLLRIFEKTRDIKEASES